MVNVATEYPIVVDQPIGWTANPPEYGFGVPKIDVDFMNGKIGGQRTPNLYFDNRSNAVRNNGSFVVRGGSAYNDGTPGNLELVNESWTNTTTPTKRTYLAMFKDEETSTGFNIIFGNTRIINTGWTMYVQRLAGGSHRPLLIYGGTASNFANHVFNAGEIVLYFISIDETANTLTAMVNGASTTIALPGTYGVAPGETLIGDGPGGGGFPWKGEVYRCMFWDDIAMSIGQMQQLSEMLPKPMVRSR
jgi:hypothetical protein